MIELEEVCCWRNCWKSFKFGSIRASWREKRRKFGRNLCQERVSYNGNILALLSCRCFVRQITLANKVSATFAIHRLSYLDCEVGSFIKPVQCRDSSGINHFELTTGTCISRASFYPLLLAEEYSDLYFFRACLKKIFRAKESTSISYL